MILRKQTHAYGIWETRLDFEPSELTYEAGVVCYWNCYTFASLGIRKKRSGKGRELWFTRPDTQPGEFRSSIHPVYSEDAIRLSIQCSPEGYSLGYDRGEDNDGLEDSWLGEVDMKTMTADPHKGMAFTGMMLGLYSFGELQKCLSPADFAYASFRNEDGVD